MNYISVLFVIASVLILATNSWKMKFSLSDVLKGRCRNVCPRVCYKVNTPDPDFQCRFYCKSVCGSPYRKARNRVVKRSVEHQDVYLHVTPLPNRLRYFDIDGDDMISLKEFSRVLGHHPDDEDVKMAFQAVDLDENGQVDQKEFRNSVWIFEEDLRREYNIMNGKSGSKGGDSSDSSDSSESKDSSDSKDSDSSDSDSKESGSDSSDSDSKESGSDSSDSKDSDSDSKDSDSDSKDSDSKENSSDSKDSDSKSDSKDSDDSSDSDSKGSKSKDNDSKGGSDSKDSDNDSKDSKENGSDSKDSDDDSKEDDGKDSKDDNGKSDDLNKKDDTDDGKTKLPKISAAENDLTIQNKDQKFKDSLLNGNLLENKPVEPKTVSGDKQLNAVRLPHPLDKFATKIRLLPRLTTRAMADIKRRRPSGNTIVTPPTSRDPLQIWANLQRDNEDENNQRRKDLQRMDQQGEEILPYTDKNTMPFVMKVPSLTNFLHAAAAS